MRGHRRGPQFGSMWRVELRAGQQQGGILEAGWPAIVDAQTRVFARVT